MQTLSKYLDTKDFDLELIDISQIKDVEDFLPKNNVFDLNIAEAGLIHVLHAENFCQDTIIKIEKYISFLEKTKSQAWADAALNKAAQKGYKTAKEREWYALSDENYVDIINQINVAKAARKWFESKATYFRTWHYAFKSFLNRDYSLEKLGSISTMSVNHFAEPQTFTKTKPNDFGGDVDWSDE
jgi:hypothetical protein